MEDVVPQSRAIEEQRGRGACERDGKEEAMSGWEEWYPRQTAPHPLEHVSEHRAAKRFQNRCMVGDGPKEVAAIAV